MKHYRTGFTLAEVLITIGIIGVVAAMTLPTVIQHHRKQVIETKLKKAASIINQTLQRARIDYDDDGNPWANREPFVHNDPDIALEMFNKYYAPYMKLVKVEKTQKGVVAYMPDGIGIYFRKRCTDSGAWGCVLHVICIDTKACENIDESKSTEQIINGKDIFVINTNGNTTSGMTNMTHEEIIESCKNHTKEFSCTYLISSNGWKIPKDYPLKF